jgi:pimeloyl-ACP methyl ester carboxylesterase
LSASSYDIFVGGGGDDLSGLGLGVVRRAAARHAARTGRPVLYLPNARPGRLRRAIRAAAERGERLSLVGHSWGGVDAYEAAVAALRQGLPVASLVTLDPVSGLLRRPAPWPGGAFWLNVTLRPSRRDYTDWLTRLWPFACTPSRLPLAAADRDVVLDLHHWDVEGMLGLSGARERLGGGP